MLKASELRIGNLIYGISDRIETVYSISEDLIKTRGGKSFWDDTPKAYSPIPVTEKILPKLGFTQDKEGDFILEHYRKAFMISRAQDEDLILLFRIDIGLDWSELKDIKNVHDLQNIFYALTGEELPINLQ